MQDERCWLQVIELHLDGIKVFRAFGQVSEPAFGVGVLIWKQPVIGSQLKLPSARAGKTDDGGAETPGITGLNASSKEHPDVSSLTGARNLQRGWHAERLARLHEHPCVLSPFRFVEVDREEIAAVVFQQRIHADRVFTSKMVIDHHIGQRDQHAIAAVPTLDARLLAHADSPFICAGRRIT